ncbi:MULTISPECIES: siderophore-interacting protein [Brevibacterium]|uniref:NADPH-dependent ferric siderophore reductase, contains FAD-binding and SIP domains n=2 Tax=Brevibacterium antiquum TaxID=234835 RepID=A0A2H1JB39_9MICO|nr:MULTISPECIES: siderophore-interacting protein [Brevibacterium]SMX70678.1 NADPH-dependent ferric siderophore reductase, contains FAD-binding and SIP domains [Brevibacterium antiquum]SMX84382.1 NADPH-dependent ferric siderophore reductase, contains FAD-binding and SIP domains [Brevibacterium antiquum CNRZ 918]HCG57064.1 siderophore-interacting protein [Brevibacterium sp.]
MSTTPSTPERSARPPRPQAVMSVQEVAKITPNLIRIKVGGDGFDAISNNEATDKYVKLMFADPQHGLTPPYDLTELRENSPEKLPRKRTYTVREINEDEKWLSLDFVIHGGEGVAGPWATMAQPGDTIVMVGAGGKYQPDPVAPWHLLIADHTAIPAVSTAVEAMDTQARGIVIAAVADEADRLLPETPAGVSVVWVDNDDELIAAVRGLDWCEGTPQVFAHGERETITTIRRVLKEHEVPRELLSISAYWARGRAEDQFQAEKREPIGKID